VGTLKRMVTEWRHASWRRHGEQLLLDTFWPSDYRIGSVVWHHGQRYQITRYDHASDAQLFAVWGKPIVHAVASVEPDPRIKRLLRTPRAH
jgi:hypothetical protein